MLRLVINKLGKRNALAKFRYFSDAMPTDLPGLSPTQLRKIEVIDRHLRNQHLIVEDSLSATERDQVRRRRIIYRSKQRGWLEVDILLGSWAVQNVPTLTTEELDEYELLLECETVDIFSYISKNTGEVPSFLENSKILKKIQSYAVGITSDMSTPDSYASIKRRSNLT